MDKETCVNFFKSRTLSVKNRAKKKSKKPARAQKRHNESQKGPKRPNKDSMNFQTDVCHVENNTTCVNFYKSRTLNDTKNRPKRPKLGHKKA